MNVEIRHRPITVEDEVALATQLFDHLVASHGATAREAFQVVIRSVLYRTAPR